MYCVLSMHISEPQAVKISRALHYSVPHNHTVVLAHKTAAVIIIKPISLISRDKQIELQTSKQFIFLCSALFV